MERYRDYEDCEDFDDYEENYPNQCVRKKKISSRDNFPSMIYDLVQNINWKTAIFIFMFGVFIFSDVFVEIFLTNIDGSVYGDTTTTKGTMIQLMFLTIGYIIIDVLIRSDFI